MSKPQIIEVRDAKMKAPIWEVVALDSKGKLRYSYWTKDKYPDQIAAYMAALKMINGEIDGCDKAPRKEQDHADRLQFRRAPTEARQD